MVEFGRIAERIAGHLSELAEMRKIGSEELSEIGSDAVGNGKINLYPGVPSYGCHDLSHFVSLSSPAYVKGKRGHLSCRQAIEKIVQHIQGKCMNRTRVAILVTDSWDSSASHEWEANLQQIANTIHFEIYLIAGQNVSKIELESSSNLVGSSSANYCIVRLPCRVSRSKTGFGFGSFRSCENKAKKLLVMRGQGFHNGTAGWIGEA